MAQLYPRYTRLYPTHIPLTKVATWAFGLDTALELVSGASFGCVLHHFSGPTRFKWSRGQVRPEIGRKLGKNNQKKLAKVANWAKSL